MSKSHCNGRSAGSRFAQKARLWATASIVALGAGGLVPHAARAASFTAGSEAQLDQAIANAIAAGGSSTITLTNDFAVTGPIAAVNGGNTPITIDMAGHTVTGPGFTATGTGSPNYTFTDGGALHLSGVTSALMPITVTGSTLQIENGGQQTFNGTASITGTLGVSGAGSSLTAGTFSAGLASGVTTIQIDGGGLLHASSGITFGEANGAQVNFTITGAGSQVSETVGTFSLGSAGTNAQAAMTISNGGALNNTLALNDGGATATGVSSILVTGAGSSLTDRTTITLLRSSLSVQADGAVTTNNLALGSGTSDASLQVSGAGSSAAITSALTVTGTGAGVGGVRVDTGGAVTAGSLSVTGSSVDLESGGQLTVAGAASFTGNATLTANGAGSALTTSTLQLQSTASTTTTVLIENGGVVHATSTNTSSPSSWANASGSKLNITVTGAGSRLDIDHSIAVSSPPASTTSILVSNGAAMTVGGRINFGAVTQTPTTLSTLQVDGAGSSLTVGDILDLLHGNVSVTGGGSISAGSIALGGVNGGANLLVSGAGSSVTSTGAVTLGNANNTTSTVTLANGGVLTGPSVAMATAATRTSVLNIGGAEGQAATGAGTLNTPTITFGAGTGRINFNHTSSDYIFSAGISGNGAINQVAGVTHLTGDSSGFTGATTVSGGTLSVDGSLAASAIDVLSGATLAGSGTAGNTTIHAGGIIAPGGVNSTLHINGAFAQQAGSTYQVQIDPTSNASTQIAATGAATIASGASLNVIKASAANYHLGSVYTLVSAGGGLSGTYGYGQQLVSAFLALKDTYDAGHAYLSVVQTADPASVADNPNGKSAAGGLPSSGDLTDGVLNSQNDADAAKLLAQLSGDGHAAARGVLVSDSRLVRDLAIDRVQGLFCSAEGLGGPSNPNAACPADGRPSAWGQAFSGWGHTDGDGNAGSVNRTTGGFLIGADTAVAGTWRAGAFAGFSHTDLMLDGNSASADIDSYHLGAYGGTQYGRLGVRLGGGYTFHDVHTNRQVQLPGLPQQLQADYGADTAQGFGQAGYRLDIGKVSVEPFVEAAYVSVHANGFTERGGVAALTGQASDTDAIYSTLGLKPSLPLAFGEVQASLHGTFGWRHDYSDLSPVSTVRFVAGGSAFGVQGAPLERDEGLAEVGLDMKNDYAVVGITYGAEGWRHDFDQTVRVNLRLDF